MKLLADTRRVVPFCAGQWLCKVFRVSGMENYFSLAMQELEAGRRVFAAMVAANKKGSPGTPAARMLVFEDGRQWGTVGGGIMEGRLVERAGLLLRAGGRLGPVLETRRHQAGAPEETSGLVCGGEQTTVLMIWEGEADRELLAGVLSCIRNEQPGVLRVTSAGMSLEGPLIDARCGSVLRQTPDAWEYFCNLLNPRRILILGGGHCGVATARLMQGLSYAVTVVEPRPEVYTLEGLPPGVRLCRGNYQEEACALAFPELTLVVVMTHSFPTDVEALMAVLSRPFPDIGVMGSAPKIERIRRALTERGVPPEQQARLSAPVGLPMDSDTPEEIAVSVAARILLNRLEATTTDLP